MIDKTIKTDCRRCGTCCRKGGPALHGPDKTLVETGRIQLKDLYTIRKGELVRDNVKGGLVRAEGDIIKIKGVPDSGTCIFLEPAENSCRIYADRPLECRTLECWNPGPLENFYLQDRLARKDLLKNIEGLWDLVADHEKRCTYADLAKLAGQARKGDASKAITAMVDYDRELRQVVIERARLDPGVTDFLFGRPLSVTKQMFGL